LYLDRRGAEFVLCRQCKECALLVVDSLRAAAPSLEENDSRFRGVLDMLARVSEKTGVVVLLIHHARKPQRGAPAGAAKMAIRGSGAIFDACASVLVFEAEKGQATRVHHEKARTSGRTTDDLVLEIQDVEVDGDLRGGLVVEARRSSSRFTNDAACPVGEIKRRIVAVLRERGSVPGKQALRELVAGNRDAVYQALEELRRDGVVAQRGTYHRPLFALAEAS
jgi:hypothetical protein